MPPPDPPAPDDPIRRALFAEAGQMFRHFVQLRYYSLLGFGGASAALIALYFQYNVLDTVQRWAVCAFAAIIALLCLAFEVRIAQLVTHFQRQMNDLAAGWNHGGFVPEGDRVKDLDITSLAARAIYLFAAVMWIVFASPLLRWLLK